MMHKAHPGDGELLESREASLPAVEEHLSGCARCQARLAELEGALDRYRRVYRDAGPLTGVGEGEAARARLEEQVASAPALRRSGGGRGAYAAGGAIAAAWLIWAIVPSARGALPDSRLTPGVTRTSSREQVCVGVADDQTPPAELANAVFREYGIRQPHPREYEVDYLITPALGGADDIRNLWPQRYGDGVWTAHVKDALEDHLKALVCEGRLDLAVAQREIASDWIAAYRKYFGTARPLAAHVAFRKDRPWE